MVITKPIRHTEIDKEPSLKKNRDWLELDWEELNKRILRKKTERGTDIAISLEEGVSLKVGDVLYEDEESEIIVRTTLEDVFVIKPKNIEEMGKAAFELGNRHTPCLIEQGDIIVRYDSTLPSLLEEVGVSYTQEKRRFHKPFKYKGHHHHHD